MKQKYLIVGVVLVIVVATVYFSNKKVDITPLQELDEQQQINEEQKQDDPIVQELPNALQGVLKDSNDKNRGNMMLLLNDSDRVIYLNTSRDFSSLLGKDVVVTIEGSLDDFRLVDIKAK